MAEQVKIGYKRLFEVRLLHHYWLDEGKVVFDSLADDERGKRLLTYDVRPFLSVAPTATTEQRLKGLRCVFKTTALGFVVAAPASVHVPDDALFEFVLTVQSADFFNYTALTLRKQDIYELYHQPEDKIYRYKENVPVFSNLTGAFRGAILNKSLFLSTEIPPLSANDQVEALVQFGTALPSIALLQLTSDQPAPTTQQLNGTATAPLPVFFHQGDAPQIPPPSGLGGVPLRGIELTEEIPEDVFGLIRIVAVNASDADFSCTSAGLAKDVGPVFQIRFKNRSTIWTYYDKRTGKTNIPISTEPNPLPLTFFGNASPTKKQKPSGGFVKVADPSALPKVTGLISEIFE